MSLRWIGLRRYTRNNIKAFVLLDVLIALGLMATFLIIIYQLKVQNIDRVENINNIAKIINETMTSIKLNPLNPNFMANP